MSKSYVPPSVKFAGISLGVPLLLFLLVVGIRGCSTYSDDQARYEIWHGTQVPGTAQWLEVDSARGILKHLFADEQSRTGPPVPGEGWVVQDHRDTGGVVQFMKDYQNKVSPREIIIHGQTYILKSASDYHEWMEFYRLLSSQYRPDISRQFEKGPDFFAKGIN